MDQLKRYLLFPQLGDEGAYAIIHQQDQTDFEGIHELAKSHLYAPEDVEILDLDERSWLTESEVLAACTNGLKLGVCCQLQPEIEPTQYKGYQYKLLAVSGQRALIEWQRDPPLPGIKPMQLWASIYHLQLAS